MKNAAIKKRSDHNAMDFEGMAAFAKQLKRLRKSKGISQEQLAFECGVSARQISRIETGKTNTTLSMQIILARALEVSLPELLNFAISQGAFEEHLMGEFGSIDKEIERLKKENTQLKEEIRQLKSSRIHARKKI